MTKKSVLATIASMATVLAAAAAYAWVGDECDTCGGSAKLGVTVINPQRCQSEADNCDSTDCTSSDYLVACPLIELTSTSGSACSPATRTIMMCDRWIEQSSMQVVSGCDRCLSQSMTENTSWNPGSLYCTGQTSGPGAGTYRYEIVVNDITNAPQGCDQCSNGCYQGGCINNGGCNGDLADYQGCWITLN